MAAPLPDSSLDAILAVQLTVAWAGGGRCSPTRLGWWGTLIVTFFLRVGDRVVPRTVTSGQPLAA